MIYFIFFMVGVIIKSSPCIKCGRIMSHGCYCTLINVKNYNSALLFMLSFLCVHVITVSYYCMCSTFLNLSVFIDYSLDLLPVLSISNNILMIRLPSHLRCRDDTLKLMHVVKTMKGAAARFIIYAP